MSDIEVQEDYFNDDSNYYAYDPYEQDAQDEVEAATQTNNKYFNEQKLYNHILERCKYEILSIFPILNLDQVLALAIQYKFNFEKIKTILATHFENIKQLNKLVKYQNYTQVNCQICLQNYKGTFNQCCNRVCQCCLAQHLNQSIKQWKLDLVCPVCFSKIEVSLLGKNMFLQFRKRLVVQYMRSQSNYVQCLDCHNFIQYWKDKKVIECSCNCQICHDCRGFAHRPLSCQTYQKWNGKIVAQTRNLLYIEKNAKKCQMCGWFIQKNSGCNHMTCLKCKYQFCWLCLGKWSNHSNCSAFDKEGKLDEKKTVITKAQTQKLQFYAGRFQNFQSGQKYAQKMREKMPKYINTLCFLLDQRQQDFSFFNCAINTIIMTRRRIKCLYAYIYMVNLSNKDKQLLEYNIETIQSNLEGLTLTMEGVLKTLQDQNLINVSEVQALGGKITQYTNNIYKFMSLILDETKFKKL